MDHLTEEHKQKLRGKIPWNKGLTKETSEGVLEGSKKLIGRKHTEETIQKLSGSNNHNYGKTAWNKGIPVSEEQKELNRLRNLGANNPMYGKHHSEESKKRIGKSVKGQTPWNKGNRNRKQRTPRACSVCGRIRLIHANHGGQSLCKSCYNRSYVRAEEKCGLCGKMGVISKTENNTRVCRTCCGRQYKNTHKRECSICKKLATVDTRINGMPICHHCNNNRRRLSDPRLDVTIKLRIRFHNAFKRYSRNGKVKSSKEYGIDYQKIFEHIGPCPGDRKLYDIDHIKPLHIFNFDDPEQIKLAFAPENHQWLLKTENARKGGKYKTNDYL
jgi:hypothetical protein